MSAVSPPSPERARKIVSIVLGRVKEAESQASIAAAVRKSEATITRLIGDHLDTFGDVLACLNLKVVPADHKCLDADAYAFLTKTHAKVLRAAPELIWEQDEGGAK
jgi:hypothetical protein